MEFCILIPAHNEAQALPETVESLNRNLPSELFYNVLVVNDHSTDKTEEVLGRLMEKYRNFKYVNNKKSKGVGNAIRFGLEHWEGDAISICMADGSDSPQDVALAFNLMEKLNADCVFGTRFAESSKIKNYPPVKLLLNRLFNHLVKFAFSIDYDDFTNIFKVYNRTAIQSIMPLESSDFSIGLEMSLKAYGSNLNIINIPINWQQRSVGKSKLKLMENISSYISVFWRLRTKKNI